MAPARRTAWAKVASASPIRAGSRVHPRPRGVQRRPEEPTTDVIADRPRALDVRRESLVRPDLGKRPQTPQARGELDARDTDQRRDVDRLVHPVDGGAELTARHADDRERRERVRLVDAVLLLPCPVQRGLGQLLSASQVAEHPFDRRDHVLVAMHHRVPPETPEELIGPPPLLERVAELSGEEPGLDQAVSSERLHLAVADPDREAERLLIERRGRLPISSTDGHRARGVQQASHEVVGSHPSRRLERGRQQRFALLVPIGPPQQMDERGQGATLEPATTAFRARSSRGQGELVIGVGIREPAELLAHLRA